MTTPAEIYRATAGPYARVRQADPRIAAAIAAAVGPGRVLNVGAGTGSYEAACGVVAAVEPSAAMIARRPAGAAPAVRALAERLPFAARAFDVALATLTVHHWRDLDAGLAELARVARRIVIFTWDPAFARRLWLSEYLPSALVEWDAGRFPAIGRLAAALGGATVSAVPIPHDCTDGFAGAYWRRPEAYLDPMVRQGISSLAGWPGDLAPGWARLAEDLSSGVFAARHAELLGRVSADLGYRLVVGA